jgi:alpha-galactosidase
MCICSLPHDPFKMPWYNVANSSDPTSLHQVRRRIKVEKAFRGPSFCVGDCYQIPLQEWDEWSVPESFESALGAGAQLTTLYSNLSEAQRRKWQLWFGLYNRLMLSSGQYLNLYDLAWDKPEAHVVRKNGRIYYAFYAERWPRIRPLVLRGLEQGKTYRVNDYVNGADLGEVTADKPEINCSFAGSLLVVAEPTK